MNALPLQFLMLIFAGWVNRHQHDVIEYLQEENRALLEHGFDPIRTKGMSWETFLKAQCGGGNIVSEYCSD